MSVEKWIKQKQNRIQSDNTAEETTRLVAKKNILSQIRDRMIQKYRMEDINNRKRFDEISRDAWVMIEEEIRSMNQEMYFDFQEISEILENLIQTMFGYGILDSLIHDETITEIMVNGIEKIFLERNGEIVRAKNKKGENLQFNSAEELLYVIEKIVAPINRKVDESNPIVDARLPNGFRVNIVLDVVSLDGTVITIRKFPEDPYTMEKLVALGAIDHKAARYLKTLVRCKYNIFVSGGTGSGKTTFLNALSDCIGSQERVITIEDSAELKINGIENLVRLETRPPNVEGKGEITARELLKSALRMRPDRIVVGEVRGPEALDMLSAMNTGHDGSLSTGHANAPRDMLSRLETMVLTSGLELPLVSIRQQIGSAIEILVHLGRLSNGTRRVLQITEIAGTEKNEYILQDLFRFEMVGTSGQGRLQWTKRKLVRRRKVQLFKRIEGTDKKLTTDHVEAEKSETKVKTRLLRREKLQEKVKRIQPMILSKNESAKESGILRRCLKELLPEENRTEPEELRNKIETIA